jgi:hypothetical protein
MLWRNLVFLSGIGGSRKDEIICKTPKKWVAKNAKDRFKCGRNMNLGAPRSNIMCGANNRRIEYEQENNSTDYFGGFGNDKNFRRDSAPNLTEDRKIVVLILHRIFYTRQRCLIRSLPVMKPRVFNTICRQNARAWSGKQEFTSAGESMHVLLVLQNHDCVLRPQGHSSSWTRCIKTNSDSAVLSVSTGKVMEICSKGKTRIPA